MGLKEFEKLNQPTIYGGDENQILDILKLPDEKLSVFLFGHKPTMNYLAALFSKERLHVPVRYHDTQPEGGSLERHCTGSICS